ncbi:MAG: T9SS type A sorting domain-containing protein, partial [Candidatus Edwardsbacteria bacterium]
VHTWDLSATYDAKNIEWGMFHHDIYHTGNYHFVPGQLTSYSSLATAYNNGRKLVRVPNTNTLWATYESANKIFATSSADGGTSWKLPVLIGNGTFPAIDLDSQNKPCLAWVSGSNVCYTRLASVAPPETLVLPVCTTSEPSLAVTSADIAYLVTTRYYTIPHREGDLFCYQFPVTDITVATEELIGTGGTQSFNSVAVDRFGYPHVVWQRDDGEIYYSTKNTGGWSTPVNLSSSPNNLSQHPTIDIYGDRITVLWAEEQAEGTRIFDIYTTQRYLTGAWSSPSSVRPTPDNSEYPVFAENNWISWAENLSGTNWETYLWNIAYMETPENLSQSSAVSNFPHIEHRLTGTLVRPVHTIYEIWTEGTKSPYEIAFKQKQYIGIPSAFYTMEGGTEEGSPYLVSREGYLVYPSGYAVDYSTTALEYQFPNLSPEMSYQLKVVSYHESAGEWKQMLKVTRGSARLIKFKAGIPDTVVLSLPPAAFKDGVLNFQIIRKDGEYAAIIKAELYQFEKEEGEGCGGGAMTTNSVISHQPLVFSLGQAYPNPFSNQATIKYQLPKESDVSLKIYNIAGQLVKTLVNENVGAGFYTCPWDGKNESGKPVASGVYFYRLQAGDFTVTKKMIILR